MLPSSTTEFSYMPSSEIRSHTKDERHFFQPCNRLSRWPRESGQAIRITPGKSVLQNPARFRARPPLLRWRLSTPWLFRLRAAKCIPRLRAIEHESRSEERRV